MWNAPAIKERVRVLYANGTNSSEFREFYTVKEAPRSISALQSATHPFALEYTVANAVLHILSKVRHIL